MKTRFAIVLLLATLLPAGAHAAPNGAPAECAAAFARGNEAYAAGRWDEARLSWEKCLDLGVRDRRVYYNLGNAHFRLGETGWAILHYEKALRIDPADADARANLELARSKRADLRPARESDPVFEKLWALHSRLSVPLGLDALLALSFLFGAGLSLAVLFRGRVRHCGAALAVVAFLAALPVALSTGYKIWADEFDARGVVLESAVDLRSGPSSRDQVLATLHSGTDLEVRSKTGEWFLVRAGDDLEGYLPARSLGLVNEDALR